MSEDKDPISKALGIDPLPEFNRVKTIISDAHDNSVNTDFEAARSNIYEIISNGQEAMHRLGALAVQAENPKVFESLSKLMDTMLRANKDLLELQKRTKELNNNNGNATKVINNTLMVGTTSELNKILKEIKNSNEQ